MPSAKAPAQNAAEVSGTAGQMRGTRPVPPTPHAAACSDLHSIVSQTEREGTGGQARVEKNGKWRAILEESWAAKSRSAREVPVFWTRTGPYAQLHVSTQHRVS